MHVRKRQTQVATEPPGQTAAIPTPQEIDTVIERTLRLPIEIQTLIIRQTIKAASHPDNYPAYLFGINVEFAQMDLEAKEAFRILKHFGFAGIIQNEVRFGILRKNQFIRLYLKTEKKHHGEARHPQQRQDLSSS